MHVRTYVVAGQTNVRRALFLGLLTAACRHFRTYLSKCIRTSCYFLVASIPDVRIIDASSCVIFPRLAIGPTAARENHARFAEAPRFVIGQMNE